MHELDIDQRRTILLLKKLLDLQITEDHPWLKQVGMVSGFFKLIIAIYAKAFGIVALIACQALLLTSLYLYLRFAVLEGKFSILIFVVISTESNSVLEFLENLLFISVLIWQA